MAEHRFQINLRGVIDLLSNHLYSGPQVYVRELLQNSVDAITARRALESQHAGEISLEVAGGKRGTPPTLVLEDNGIGLTEDEVHRFLATIGESSKRDDLGRKRADFIGQFGIGLLSCFVVSDEIVLITRRAGGGKPVEWRGRADGTYAVKTIDSDMSPGTRVYLRAKKGMEDWFETDRVKELAVHFGGLLPHPIRVAGALVNGTPPPWRSGGSRDAILEYGRTLFGAEFFDCIPLRSPVGDVDGVAYVLPYTASLATKNTHRIYLKNMLLSEDGEHVLPSWAFFVKAVVNANDLRPTASRESFYADDALEATQEALGQCLRDYLVKLAATDRRRLARLIELHYLPIKALAVEDDEFFKLFIDHLPFETTAGRVTLKDHVKANGGIRYVRTVDQFRQIARVASAQGIGVVNGGYVYDAELLEKYGEMNRKASVEAVDPADLAQQFEEVGLEDREKVFALLKAADEALKPFRCRAEIRTFKPAELPALYSSSADEDYHRSIETSKDAADGHWSGILDNLKGARGSAPGAELCFNFANELVKRLAELKDRKLVKLAVQMLYVQALLLGHHPLKQKEMQLLNEGLTGLIERSLGGTAD